jgi:hypothetical protein
MFLLLVEVDILSAEQEWQRINEFAFDGNVNLCLEVSLIRCGDVDARDSGAGCR